MKRKSRIVSFIIMLALITVSFREGYSYAYLPESSDYIVTIPSSVSFEKNEDQIVNPVEIPVEVSGDVEGNHTLKVSLKKSDSLCELPAPTDDGNSSCSGAEKKRCYALKLEAPQKEPVYSIIKKKHIDGSNGNSEYYCVREKDFINNLYTFLEVDYGEQVSGSANLLLEVPYPLQPDYVEPEELYVYSDPRLPEERIGNYKATLEFVISCDENDP